MNSKGATGGAWGHNLKFILDIPGADEEEKKKFLGIFNGCFETYTSCYGKKLGILGGHKL